MPAGSFGSRSISAVAAAAASAILISGTLSSAGSPGAVSETSPLPPGRRTSDSGIETFPPRAVSQSFVSVGATVSGAASPVTDSVTS